ncbi:hypothetical protein Droror1_Dr00026585 [Drosera rotundifolia]
MRFSLSPPKEERCQRIEARLNASGKRMSRGEYQDQEIERLQLNLINFRVLSIIKTRL